MLYIDTSVLLVYTLTQAIERARFLQTEKFFAKVAAGALPIATSFYALHELYVFAIDNAPKFNLGARFGKAALEKIFALPVQILPLVSRADRARHANTFGALRDASDVPHAISAYVYGCTAIVAYDQHFDAIHDILPHTHPDDYV